MFASIARLALVVAAVFGVYKLYPRLQPTLEPIIKPEVLGAKIIHPAIKTINDFLPDKFQIPSPRQSDSEGGQVDGAATSNNAVSNVVNTVIEDVKKKAGEIAEEQIDAAKKEAGKAFCQVLIEKVKTECGNNP
ncbi:MAG: hypothetical protein AAB548_01670 [Patescibacteria group bacterium]